MNSLGVGASEEDMKQRTLGDFERDNHVLGCPAHVGIDLHRCSRRQGCRWLWSTTIILAAPVVASITGYRVHAMRDQHSEKESNRQNPLTHPAKLVDAVQAVQAACGQDRLGDRSVDRRDS